MRSASSEAFLAPGPVSVDRAEQEQRNEPAPGTSAAERRKNAPPESADRAGTRGQYLGLYRFKGGNDGMLAAGYILHGIAARMGVHSNAVNQHPADSIPIFRVEVDGLIAAGLHDDFAGGADLPMRRAVNFNGDNRILRILVSRFTAGLCII